MIGALVLFFYVNHYFVIQGVHARSPSGNRLKKDLRVQGHDMKLVHLF